jgi:hypothetical protein
MEEKLRRLPWGGHGRVPRAAFTLVGRAARLPSRNPFW